MKPSEFRTSISVEYNYEKSDKNYRNCYVAKKGIISKLFQILIAQVEDLTKDCVKISRPYLLYFSKNKP